MKLFDADQLELMAAAFSDAYIALGQSDRTDAATELVAGRVIELAAADAALRAGTCKLSRAED